MKRLLPVVAILVMQIFFPAPMVSATVKDNGGIAYYSSTGKYGYTYNYPSQSQAERNATIHRQDVGGKDCHSIVWFKNNCGVIAGAGKWVDIW